MFGEEVEAKTVREGLFCREWEVWVAAGKPGKNDHHESRQDYPWQVIPRRECHDDNSGCVFLCERFSFSSRLQLHRTGRKLGAPQKEQFPAPISTAYYPC